MFYFRIVLLCGAIICAFSYTYFHCGDVNSGKQFSGTKILNLW